MYHAPFGAQQTAAIRFAHRIQRAVFIPHFTFLRRQARREGFQQSGFSRAGLAHDAQHFTGPQFKRDVAEAFARRIKMGQMIDRE